MLPALVSGTLLSTAAGAGVACLAIVAGTGASVLLLVLAGAVVGASLHAPIASASARALAVRIVVDIWYTLLLERYDERSLRSQ